MRKAFSYTKSIHQVNGVTPWGVITAALGGSGHHKAGLRTLAAVPPEEPPGAWFSFQGGTGVRFSFAAKGARGSASRP